jgi:hypothetical protein
MAGDGFNRRDFLKQAGALTAAGTAVFSNEERLLQAHQAPGNAPQGPPPENRFNLRREQAVADVPGPLPTGRLGRLQFTRLIAGHNPVGWQAHSRDLIYTSQLLRAYFTDDKVLETYQKYEENGINASMLRIETRSLALAKRYKQERGGKIQWMAQLVINEKDLTSDLDKAVEAGVVAAHIRGLEGDRFCKNQRMDMLGQALELIKKAGIVAGLGSHSIDPLIEAERLGLPADYYYKTFNSAQYWSAGPPVPPDPDWKPTKEQLVQSEYATSTHDNIWETTPKATAEFFAKVEKPFVAYKVLAAGAIQPRDGFKYAFEKGADFICVGMYDFQLKDDVNITKGLLAGTLDRTRPWIGTES